MSSIVQWDSSLISRYDMAGPRYTSYPTAVQFREDISVLDLKRALHLSRKQKKPLSLYIHVPFCANICYYCGCNKVITKNRGYSEPYVDRLIKEIASVSKDLSRDQVVEQIHFGGGTPTFLTTDQIGRIIGALKDNFQFADNADCDFSIEIDPREADWTVMGALREQGFNRISLGVQDFNTDVQIAINRLQSFEQTQVIIEAARTLQYRSVNIDLIYGLPKQTVEKFSKTVKEVIGLQPDRLSVFNYAHLPDRFKPQRRINESELPSSPEKLRILQNTIEQLTSVGYHFIGMDHFALADDELAYAQEEGTLYRNFQGYTTHGHCDLIGFGVSAISQIGDFYCQNTSDLSLYEESIKRGDSAIKRGLICHEDDRIRRAVIQQIICHFYLDFSKIEQQFGIDFKSYFRELFPQLQAMAKDNLLELTNDKLIVHNSGRLLVRSVCMLFDNYLTQEMPQRFSRVI